jgi:hypothetical protein
MKKRSSVRKRARKTLSIDGSSAVIAAQWICVRACRPGPNFFGVGIEDRLILGRHGLVAKGLDGGVVG